MRTYQVRRAGALTIGRRALALTLSTVLTATLATVVAAQPAAAQQAIGFPEFSGPAEPVPPEPAGFTVDGMMQAMYEADLSQASGNAQPDGTEFWMDRLLARSGSDPATNSRLWTRGRGLFMRTHNNSVIGFGGEAAYWDTLPGASFGGSMYTVEVGESSMSQVVSSRRQTPSHWRQSYQGGGLEVEVTKFITHNNVAVTNLAITNTTGSTMDVPLSARSPYATTPDGDELTDVVDTRFALTLLFPRLSGDDLTVDGSQLVGAVTVEPGATVETKVTMGFVTEEIAESAGEYEQYRGADPGEAFATHLQVYNKWWADNLPYIDVPDDAIKKFIYYRWWIMRYNLLDADIPGNDFQFPVGIEGVTGYNNSIALTVPMIIDELKYLRDPTYAYGTMLSAGEGSENARYADNPGKPTNWNDSYLQYTTDAAWRAYQVYGGQPDIIGNLAHYGERDVKSQLDFHTPPGSDPNLLWYCCNYLNGNDADNPSFSYFGRGNERVESAYVYANAMATSEAYDLLGETDKAAEMREIAGNVQDALLDRLWDDESQLFLHRDIQTDTLIPWKEINNYYPYTVGLVPNEEPYLNALRLFDDPEEYPIFPFYTANQADQAQRGGGSNNFSQINSTVQFRLLSSVLRNYDTDAVDEQWYKKLLYWNAWAHFVDGNTDWPDANEFWFNWDPDTQTFGRSGIHHSILGSSIWTVIEDVMGLRPRTDDAVELWPIDIDWDHFTVTDVNYRGSDLTIVWDDPTDGESHYPGVPEGYSVFIDGGRAFTLDGLVHAIWDPATGQVSLPDADGAVLFSAADRDLSAPHEVELSGERVVDIFQKAGVDIAEVGGPARNQDRPNHALRATGSASYTDPAAETDAYPATDVDAAVDGFTINLPFWGSAGSGNGQDWYELDFGRPTTVTDVKLYFYNDRETLGVPDQHRVTATSDRYREPAAYTIQVWRDDTGWVDVNDQVRTPTYPRSNYNSVRFRPTTAKSLRVLMTHRQGYGTGLKEIQAFHTIGPPPAAPDNQPPQVIVREDPAFEASGQARVEAIVKDDGLPGGTLDAGWTVVSGPGLALFDDPTSHTAVASFSEDGEYVVELTATDGELTTSEQLTITVTGVGSGAPNLAPRADPSCTNTSPWETCEAINLASDGSSPPQYGTWPTNGDQWVQLDWDQPVRVDSADMWFFQDVPPGANGGVQAPATWNLQYWDAGAEEFVDVSSPEGFGTELDEFNPASFDPVTTTRLRANLIARDGQAPAEGVGVRRWRVYAEQPEAVEPVEVSTLVGELPDLPPRVTLIFAGDAQLDAEVTWEAVTPDQVDAPGSFTVRGLVDATSLLATATVHVVEQEP